MTMMRYATLAIALAAAIGFAAPTLAEPNGADAPDKTRDVETAASSSKSSALVSVMIKSYVSDPSLTPLRNTGIDTVRRLSTGVFCLKPVKSIHAQNLVASVSVNWISSFGNNLQAMAAAPSFDCKKSEFEVRTFDFTPPNGFVPSDKVSFTLVVP